MPLQTVRELPNLHCTVPGDYAVCKNMTQDNNRGKWSLYNLFLLYSFFAISGCFHLLISNGFQDALTGIATADSLKLSQQHSLPLSLLLVFANDWAGIGDKRKTASMGEACGLCSPLWNFSEDPGQILPTSLKPLSSGIEQWNMWGGRDCGPVIFKVWSSDLLAASASPGSMLEMTILRHMASLLT